jgi:cysteinyl-tRNA synthetase
MAPPSKNPAKKIAKMNDPIATLCIASFLVRCFGRLGILDVFIGDDVGIDIRHYNLPSIPRHYARIKGIANKAFIMNHTIHLYNTKTRTLEPFTPIIEGSVGIYSCGPTVYHYQHLGNMRAVIFADTLRRMFLGEGYKVSHVINITDVGHNVDDGDTGEDKMEKGSRREGKSVWEIAKMYTDAYFHDLMLLNVPLDAYTFPRATDNIREQIALVEALEIAGYTYTISDGVYFDTSKFKAYGDFAQLYIEGLKSGARVEENTEKKNITDFALWKFSPKDEQRQMEWESKWGKGFPGWHIECSAMSMKYLGVHFDVHTGGVEHIPVHHTNEIAQSECATGMPYVNYWMHNNHLLDTTGKMSKSNGDFLTVSTLIEKGYNPLAYRYFLLTAHYRKELSFSFEALDAAAVAYGKLCDFAIEHKNDTGTVVTSYVDSVKEALANDLATPLAISHVWKLMKDDTITNADKYTTLFVISDVLGLGLDTAASKTFEIPHEVQELLDKRALARSSKDFTLSDTLRDEIVRLGFSVKDTDKGQVLAKL